MLNIPFESRLRRIILIVLIFIYSSSNVNCGYQDDISRGINRFLGGGLFSLGLGLIADYSTKYQQKNILENNNKKNTDKNNIYLKDVIGQDYAVAEVRDILNFFKGSDKFKSLGAYMPKGILLEGPPGTGKTLIAKALAGESGFNFYYRSASSFVELYVGMGAKNVRDLFNQAKKNKPAIIFIDEIDAIAGIDRKNNSGGGDEYRQTLNELLAQLDGFESDGAVFVLAATNNASTLDDAIKRPGRFARIIRVDLPDEKGRYDLLQYYINKLPKQECDSDIINELVYETEDFSGADLQNLVNEAAIYAANSDSESVKAEHLIFALEKVAKKNKNIIY